MTWLSQNWFFVLILVAFVAMHLFGHGGHGGHGGGGGGDRQSGGHSGHGEQARPAVGGDEAEENTSGEQPASRRHEHRGGC